MDTNTPVDTHFGNLKSRLEGRYQTLRAEIAADLVDSERTDYAAVAGQVHDRVDEAVADLLVDLRNADMDREIGEARDVEAALARLRAGTYGICMDCGTFIPFGRLDAYPTAKRCWACQESYERAHHTRRAASL
ncbi:MAG TPA: TraR/DksA C4-type zinc finger protein [Gammaproteobacteria bacterium]|nr:TraR/DksA C4-type zinc finger protein [Gammaproteobacteria bacterium]